MVVLFARSYYVMSLWLSWLSSISLSMDVYKLDQTTGGWGYDLGQRSWWYRMVHMGNVIWVDNEAARWPCCYFFAGYCPPDLIWSVSGRWTSMLKVTGKRLATNNGSTPALHLYRGGQGQSLPCEFLCGRKRTVFALWGRKRTVYNFRGRQRIVCLMGRKGAVCALWEGKTIMCLEGKWQSVPYRGGKGLCAL